MTKVLLLIFTILSLIILGDFIINLKAIDTPIISIHSEYQSHNNASRNFHYSQYIITDYGKSYISEEMSTTVEKGQSIKLHISPIFKQVNEIEVKNKREAFSLRYLTGLVLPLIGLIVLIFRLKFPNKLSTFSFVVQVALLIDLIYLVL